CRDRNLRPQCPDRNDPDTILAYISIAGRRYDRKGGRPAGLGRVHSVHEFQQTGGSMVDVTDAQLYFEGRPTSVSPLNDGVHLEACVVSIMVDRGVVRLSVTPEVPDYQRLE